jgi:hypothetical protein
MRKIGLVLTMIVLFVGNINAQSCSEIKNYVERNAYGTTYSSPSSTAISSATFYSLNEDGAQKYFAIVCFKSSGCYIYQVGSRTESNYSSTYSSSAGSAFNNYIRPFNSNLGCG